MKYLKNFYLIALALSASPAMAANLVVNGGFENSSNGVGALVRDTTVVGWEMDYNLPGRPVPPLSALYDWLAPPGIGSTRLPYGTNGFQLWGPAPTVPGTPWASPLGVDNGLVDVSPTGGLFLALDGDSNINGYLMQTINGLQLGSMYNVQFWWAAGQARLARGATTSRLEVSFGNAVQSTITHNVADQGFAGWEQVSMTFRAGGSSEVLKFLSVGTPNGLPPMVLLDGVSVSAVPEPASWAMMIMGFGLIGAAARRRKSIHLVEG